MACEGVCDYDPVVTFCAVGVEFCAPKQVVNIKIYRQSCINLWRGDARASEFFIRAPNVCVSSVGTLMLPFWHLELWHRF